MSDPLPRPSNYCIRAECRTHPVASLAHWEALSTQCRPKSLPQGLQRLFIILRILARTEAASDSLALASMSSTSSRYLGKRVANSLNPL